MDALKTHIQLLEPILRDELAHVVCRKLPVAYVASSYFAAGLIFPTRNTQAINKANLYNPDADLAEKLEVVRACGFTNEEVVSQSPSSRMKTCSVFCFVLSNHVGHATFSPYNLRASPRCFFGTAGCWTRPCIHRRFPHCKASAGGWAPHESGLHVRHLLTFTSAMLAATIALPHFSGPAPPRCL